MSASVAASRLEPFLTPAGTLCAMALDHRDALRNAFARAGVTAVGDATMQQLKVRIADALAPAVSALLLDAAAVPSCRAPGRGVFVPLEEQGHRPFAGGRLTDLLEDFGPGAAAALGVHGCKLLIYYRADHRPTAERQRALVRRVAADCHRHGLPLVVEPVVYRLATEVRSPPGSAGRLRRVPHALRPSPRPPRCVRHGLRERFRPHVRVG